MDFFFLSSFIQGNWAGCRVNFSSTPIIEGHWIIFIYCAAISMDTTALTNSVPLMASSICQSNATLSFRHFPLLYNWFSILIQTDYDHSVLVHVIYLSFTQHWTLHQLRFHGWSLLAATWHTVMTITVSLKHTVIVWKTMTVDGAVKISRSYVLTC